MRKVVTLLIGCFFFFRTYALNEDNKAAFNDHPKVRRTNVNINFDAAALISENGKDLYCEGSFVTLTVTGGNGPYQWYIGKDLYKETPTNQLVANIAGQYQVTLNGGGKTNTLNITMLAKPTKPSIIY